MSKEYAFYETFYSVQGEGFYTGVPSVWLRFFLCNLQCDGFGQEDPTNPETYELPYKDFDPIDVKNVTDLPVWRKAVIARTHGRRSSSIFKRSRHQKRLLKLLDVKWSMRITQLGISIILFHGHRYILFTRVGSR